MKTSAYDWYPPPLGTIDLGNDICRMIDDILADAYGVNICDKKVGIRVEEEKKP